jgi:hypothetical protein
VRWAPTPLSVPSLLKTLTITITITTPPLPRIFRSALPTASRPVSIVVIESTTISRSIFAARSYLQDTILANVTRPLAC